MNHLADVLRAALSGGSVIALPLALVGGLVAGMNPCCLPLYPAAAATCCAARGARRPGISSAAVAFVTGVALATSLLGVIAAAAGMTMARLRGWSAYIITLIPVLMGMHVLGWIRLPVHVPACLQRPRGATGALVTGALLSLVLAPCGTPVLASVLSYAAYRRSVVYGGLLLFIYGIGAGLPVLVVGTTADRIANRLDAGGHRAIVDRVTGYGLVIVGLFLLWVA